jgi:hypothetical protein
MAKWTPTSTPPARSGRYRAKCGVTGDTFWADFNAHDGLWYRAGTNDDIVFGARGWDICDKWRAASPRKTSVEKAEASLLKEALVTLKKVSAVLDGPVLDAVTGDYAAEHGISAALGSVRAVLDKAKGKA